MNCYKSAIYWIRPFGSASVCAKANMADRKSFHRRRLESNRPADNTTRISFLSSRLRKTQLKAYRKSLHAVTMHHKPECLHLFQKAITAGGDRSTYEWRNWTRNESKVLRGVAARFNARLWFKACIFDMGVTFWVGRKAGLKP